MNIIQSIIGAAFIAASGFALSGLATPAHALDLSAISNQDASAGLKEALNKGSAAAVAKLGVQNGFLNNPKVKIPLPEGLKTAEKAMKLLGKQKQFDELVVSMNRAAEAAAPEAKVLLVDAVKNMSVADAKGILSGGDDSVTKFFQSKTQAQLTQRFLPIVKKSTEKVGLAQQYNNLAGQAAGFGVVKQEDAKIENYVTRKAMDGLFLMIAEEEKAIRKDPIGTGSAILRKVFGS
ncbi:MAG: DUF4197 domain-containing protein [Burkholderiaceae bacterium]